MSSFGTQLSFNALFLWAERHDMLDEYCVFTNRYAIDIWTQEQAHFSRQSAYDQNALILRGIIIAFGCALEKAASKPQSSLTNVAITRDAVRRRLFSRLVETAKPIVSAMGRGMR